MTHYPLHPNQTHASPLYATVPLEEYERLKRKLDETQRETIRIAELYRRDRAAFNKEIDRLMNLIDADPEYTQALGDLAADNARLKDENALLKELNAKLQERVTRLEHELATNNK